MGSISTDRYQGHGKSSINPYHQITKYISKHTLADTWIFTSNVWFTQVTILKFNIQSSLSICQEPVAM